MNRFRAFVASLLATAGMLAMPAVVAGPCTAQLEDGWVRLPPMAMPMAAGFVRIENPCAEAVTIVGASSPAFAEVSLHQTQVVEGVSRMRPLPQLRVAAGGEATLRPGGMHLMLMQPHVPLQPGRAVVIEFELDGGGSLRGEFVIKTAAPASP